jgi:hypothetical protein
MAYSALPMPAGQLLQLMHAAGEYGSTSSRCLQLLQRTCVIAAAAAAAHFWYMLAP